jgi:hypothetical protein
MEDIADYLNSTVFDFRFDFSSVHGNVKRAPGVGRGTIRATQKRTIHSAISLSSEIASAILLGGVNGFFLTNSSADIPLCGGSSR